MTSKHFPSTNVSNFTNCLTSLNDIQITVLLLLVRSWISVILVLNSDFYWKSADSNRTHTMMLRTRYLDVLDITASLCKQAEWIKLLLVVDSWDRKSTRQWSWFPYGLDAAFAKLLWPLVLINSYSQQQQGTLHRLWHAQIISAK